MQTAEPDRRQEVVELCHGFKEVGIAFFRNVSADCTDRNGLVWNTELRAHFFPHLFVRLEEV